jgi:HD-GYP domain-containing protein (c-di-GMP phosphodiesterase class II)
MSEPVSTVQTSPEQALALSLAAAIRTAGYFTADNDVMKEVGANLAAQLRAWDAEEDGVTIGVHSHSIFIGSVRVRSTMQTYERFAFLAQTIEAKEINAITFAPGVTESELARLAMVLASAAGRGAADLNASLRKAGVTHIETEELGGGSGVQALAPVEAYAAAVQLGERLRESTQSKHVDLRQARHISQMLVDQILEDAASLAALTTVKEADDRLISHSANVAILSVLVGKRMGLGKSKLGELCLAGFLHDAGKLEVQQEVLTKPGPLDQREWEEMRRHPLIAARSLLGGRRLTPATMRAVVVAYEHHLSHDMTGYPPSELHTRVTLFGEIVAVADRYDALTTARTYRRFSFSPHEVISYLLYYAGTAFDPMVVKLFVEVMGLFPPGALLRLDSGEIGVVCEPPAPGQAVDCVRVRIWTGSRAGQVVSTGPQPDGSTLGIAVALSPDGMGMVPAMELSSFDVAREPGKAETSTPEPAGAAQEAAQVAPDAPVRAEAPLAPDAPPMGITHIEVLAAMEMPPTGLAYTGGLSATKAASPGSAVPAPGAEVPAEPPAAATEPSEPPQAAPPATL